MKSSNEPSMPTGKKARETSNPWPERRQKLRLAHAIKHFGHNLPMFDVLLSWQSIPSSMGPMFGVFMGLFLCCLTFPSREHQLPEEHSLISQLSREGLWSMF